MVKKSLALLILSVFVPLPMASGGPSTHSLTLIYSNNLYGSIEPSG
ncbi:MAG: hypothetical protein KAJ09_06575 [Deltaproteobacteria bacterium]|jgi:hypothetical protein|nr:hypothetical protein [Deltaproteobacteria bacterium]